MTMTKDTMIVAAVCRHCGETIRLEVNRADWEEWNSPNRRHIQDIFPYLTAAEREMFLTRICGACFDTIFGGMGDDESEVAR